MKTLGWPPNFVARCPVKLFEAAGGSSSWQPSGTVGELHMRPLENAMLHFQLRDLLDNQVLFEHTMRKPDAFMVAARCFFVIRLENGSFRGFGFTDDAAACEMKERVQKAVKPFSIRESTWETAVPKEFPVNEPHAIRHSTPSSSIKKASETVSYESVPRRSSSRLPSQLSTEESASPVQSLEVATFNQMPKLSTFRSKWKFVFKGLATLSHLKGLSAISQIFGWREHELEIGYPTDVKHVAHIGWDGPSVSGPSWMDELKPAPDFSSGPLREFGQPRGPDWIHDAFSAAKWTAQGSVENFGMPPLPPPEFQDLDSAESAGYRGTKHKEFSSRRKTKATFNRPRVYRT